MTALVGTVAGLARFPVKSTAGETLTSAEVDGRGVRHDRDWAVYLADGGIASGKTTHRFRKLPGLLDWRSELGTDGSPTLLDPSGTAYRVGEPAADEALSDAFGQPLALRREGSLRHHDDCGLHLITTGSLDQAGALAGEPVDPRRMRANLLVDTGALAGFVEEGWTGELSVGPELVLALGPGMPRCVMIDQPQHGVDRGAPLLRALGRAHGSVLLGLQASVRRPGTISLGDEVRLSSG